MWLRLLNRSVLTLLVIALAGCDQTGKAEQVANEFWQFVQTKDYQQAAHLTLESDPAFIQTTLFLYRNYEVILGNPKRVQHRVIIPTQLVSPSGEKTINLLTIITLKNDHWHIEYKSMVKAFMGGLKDRIQDKIDDSSDWLDQQLDDWQDLLDEILPEPEPEIPQQTA